MASKFLFILTLTLLALNYDSADAVISDKTLKKINKANEEGPYIGIVAQSTSTLNLLLQHPSFTADASINPISVRGRKFRFGEIAGERVIVVLSGSSLINAAITTQLLVSVFKTKGVVHYGVAGITDPTINIGDVIIPKFWSNSGLWSWQKFGSGEDDKLPLEDTGDFTRSLGHLRFADNAVNVSECLDHDNLLNNIWYQREEIFSVKNPEKKRQIFWVAVDAKYYNISGDLEGLDLKLEKCINEDDCLISTPKVSRIRRGTSGSIYLDNAAYRNFLVRQFGVGIVDMDSAAVALVCVQQQVPFINIKSVSNLAGGCLGNKYSPVAKKNSVTATVEFIKLVHEYNVPEPLYDM